MKYRAIESRHFPALEHLQRSQISYSAFGLWHFIKSQDVVDYQKVVFTGVQGLEYTKDALAELKRAGLVEVIDDGIGEID